MEVTMAAENQETITWRRHDFTSAWRGISIAFTVWSATQDGVTAAGPSPGVTRARLAALRRGTG